MDANSLYLNVNKIITTKEKIAEICEQMRQANGDRAWYIYCAKHDGWWVEP